MRSYECVLIIRQDMSTAQVDAIADELSAIITGSKGKIHKREYWGLKSLAYRIKKNRRGHYVLLDIEASAEAVAECDRKIGLNEDIIRSLITKTHQPNPHPSIIMKRQGDQNQQANDGDKPGGDEEKGGKRVAV